MVLREDHETARDAVRYGRHSRPKPVGARFRVPGIRFSGAAMAMSTVVGISVATTWLVSAQQNVGRPRVTSVGASPPMPSPDGSATPVASTTTPTPAPVPVLGPQALGTPAAPVRSPSPHASPTAAASSPAPSGSPSSSPAPPAPSGPPKAPVSSPPPQLGPTEPLAGRSCRELFGPSGTRHSLDLTVAEPVTALQVEFRLAFPEALPGTTPWSTLPGAVVTVLQERGTLIYRFTAPAGLDVLPGTYTFGIRGTRPTTTTKTLPPRESWTASAFALQTPRAIATRGVFF